MNGTIYKNKVNYGVNISDSQPVGQIIESASETTPAGYLPILDARQSVLCADYPDLFKKIGITYGAVDDEHFNLPCEADLNVTSDSVVKTAESLKKTIEYTLTISKSLASTWTTIIDPTRVPAGFYAFDIMIDDRSIWWTEHLSFVMYYYTSTTNDNNRASPINFNQSGHATNGYSVSLRYLRTLNTNGGKGYIQLYAPLGADCTVTVKAYRIDKD